MYGPDGSFRAEGEIHPLEKTVGAVRCCSDSTILDATARKVILLLRTAISEIRDAWDLLPSAMESLQRFLHSLCACSKIDLVVQLLRMWAQERSQSHDGLTLAFFLLLERQSMSEKNFWGLYPTVPDITAGLMDLFNCANIPMGGVHEAELHEMAMITADTAGLPWGWALALKYFSTYGRVETFWNGVVFPNLIWRIKEREKLIVGVMLRPLVVAYVPDQARNSLEQMKNCLPLCTSMETIRTVVQIEITSTLQRGLCCLVATLPRLRNSDLKGLRCIRGR